MTTSTAGGSRDQARDAAVNILVCPNTLIVGGASLVALDLAAAMRERGHRVVVLGPRGALVDRLPSLGLEWIESRAIDDGSDPEVGTRSPLWPSLVTARQIRRVVADERIDVVHTYEWPRTLEAMLGAHLWGGAPLVSSILAVRAPKFLPRTAHVIVGTADLASTVRSRGFPAVTLVEPRLDRLPGPDAGATDAEAEAFAQAHGVDAGRPTLVVASRLAGFKMDGLRLAIAAVRMVDAALPVQLVIVGEGSGEGELHELANSVNDAVGRRAVIFTGVLSDVAPAYACADLVLGMGTAVLGGMAQGKPAIVLGEDGFSALLDEGSAPSLADVGFWGEGPSEGAVARLTGHITDALCDPTRTAVLGAFARELVLARPTREQTDQRVEEVYAAAIAGIATSSTRARHAVLSIGRFVAMRARGRFSRPFRRDADQPRS